MTGRLTPFLFLRFTDISPDYPVEVFYTTAFSMPKDCTSEGVEMTSKIVEAQNIVGK